MKDIITKTPLRPMDGNQQKMKKPPLVTLQHWETALMLSNYGGNLKTLPDGLAKCQKEFEEWCVDQLTLRYPPALFDCKLDFIEHLALVAHFKARTYGYLAH
jgi:hypothetical protein